MTLVFGLIVLATLALMGLVTFDRVLQSGIEDFGYSERIARLRAYYFGHAPELTQYLASVPPGQRLAILACTTLRGQNFRTVAAMIGVVTAVLAGSAAAPLAQRGVGRPGLLDGGVQLGAEQHGQGQHEQEQQGRDR